VSGDFYYAATLTSRKTLARDVVCLSRLMAAFGRPVATWSWRCDEVPGIGTQLYVSAPC
jgi:hypothetical protein